MPEGPEIRRAADRLATKLVDEVVETVWFGLPRLEPFSEALSGQTVTALETRGKALLIHFDNDLALYSHNQLYGRWFVRAREDYPNTNRSLRVALHTQSASLLLYSASDISVLDADGVEAHPFLSGLGPDLLGADLTKQALVARLREAKFRNRALGGLYLDQGFVAGIGNYLRSEILYYARVHPKQKPSDLSAGKQRKLAAETLAVGQRAYGQGGVTNPPHLVARLKRKGAKRRDFRHSVFARAGRPCYRCGTTIDKMSVASRRLYFCASCQRL